MTQNECSCTYCYRGVCFHPIRGDGAGLGVTCDGCDFDPTSQHLAPETTQGFDHAAPIMTVMLLSNFKEQE